MAREKPKLGPLTVPAQPCAAWKARLTAALLADAIERLRQSFEGVDVGAGGSLGRGPLDRQVLALAHGIDEARFLGRVLDPGAVGLGIHLVVCARNLDVGIGIGLE